MNFDGLKAVYRTAIPEPLRRYIRSISTIFDRGQFNKEFFKYIDSMQRDSYPIMAATIAACFNPKKVLDVGCGSGGLLKALSQEGDIRCTGLEYSKRGRAVCRQKGLQVDFLNLTQPLIIDHTYDLVICLEVAEHLPEDCADLIVLSLTSGPDQILFSAATPGQGGNGHVNEQPNSYWIQKFLVQNFVWNKSMTEKIRSDWKARKVARWYANNVMVFFRRKLPLQVDR